MKNWVELSSEIEFQKSIDLSFEKPVLIFKHSTTCSISRMALDRWDRNWKDENINDFSPYYLDLLAYRNISNLIAEKLEVEHQSPQVLLIKNGSCIFSETHQSIRLQNVLSALKN